MVREARIRQGQAEGKGFGNNGDRLLASTCLNFMTTNHNPTTHNHRKDGQVAAQGRPLLPRILVLGWFGCRVHACFSFGSLRLSSCCRPRNEGGIGTNAAAKARPRRQQPTDANTRFVLEWRRKQPQVFCWACSFSKGVAMRTRRPACRLLPLPCSFLLRFPTYCMNAKPAPLPWHDWSSLNPLPPCPPHLKPSKVPFGLSSK